MGLASPNPSRQKIDKGMRLILAPKSNKALLKTEFHILHEMVKLPISFSFYGSFLYRIALHSSVRVTISKSILLFLDNIFHKFDIVGHLFQCICKRNVDVQFLKHIHEFGKLLVQFILLQMSRIQNWCRGFIYNFLFLNLFPFI